MFWSFRPSHLTFLTHRLCLAVESSRPYNWWLRLVRLWVDSLLFCGLATGNVFKSVYLLCLTLRYLNWLVLISSWELSLVYSGSRAGRCSTGECLLDQCCNLALIYSWNACGWLSSLKRAFRVGLHNVRLLTEELSLRPQLIYHYTIVVRFTVGELVVYFWVVLLCLFWQAFSWWKCGRDLAWSCVAFPKILRARCKITLWSWSSHNVRVLADLKTRNRIWGRKLLSGCLSVWSNWLWREWLVLINNFKV